MHQRFRSIFIMQMMSSSAAIIFTASSALSLSLSLCAAHIKETLCTIPLTQSTLFTTIHPPSSMKLRIRSLETKDTFRVEVPDSWSLSQFKEVISQRIPSSSSLSSALYLSLNRKDELLGPSPQDSLHSLGLTSGDLVYYALDPRAFSAPTPAAPARTPVQAQQQAKDSGIPEPLSRARGVDRDICEVGIKGSEGFGSRSAESEMSDDKVQDSNNAHEGKIPDFSDAQIGEALKGETLEFSGTECMDVDCGYDVVDKGFSVPCFLRKMLRDEVGDDGRDHKLLVIAVHAVFIESGFVGFDSTSRMRVDKFHLPDEWPSNAFSLSLWYAVPELLNSSSEVAETIVLKFQSLGKFVNIYGSLARNGSGVHRVCLDEHRFTPSLSFVWKNSDYSDGTDTAFEFSKIFSEKEVFEFWKIVKDGLALPLLIDLCERTGSAPPPCLMHLPMELKLKILESLPGVEIAKMGCVSSEFRYLSLNNDLWRQKFLGEFGDREIQEDSMWKVKFALLWETRRKRRRAYMMPRRVPHERAVHFPVRRRRDADPFRFPDSVIVGGDFDWWPAIPFDANFGQPGLQFPHRPARCNFSPNCNLGGSSP